MSEHDLLLALQSRVTQLEYRLERAEADLEKLRGSGFEPGDRLRERVRYWERRADALQSCLNDPDFRRGGKKAVEQWRIDLDNAAHKLALARSRVELFEVRHDRKKQRERFIANCLAAAP